jgi:hypothetical protein
MDVLFQDPAAGGEGMDIEPIFENHCQYINFKQHY